MADPVETDCEKDFKRCKSKCFDELVEAIKKSGDVATAADIAAYQKCRARCKRAKQICDETQD
jgi:hypothetical protein